MSIWTIFILILGGVALGKLLSGYRIGNIKDNKNNNDWRK